MATEKPPTASEALANLEQQLTCPVCLDRYTHPRTLPCLHSFCHGCLCRFPEEVKKDKHFITCPVCRQTTQQPDKGVSGFQSAFLINNFLELYKVLEKVSGSKQNNCENCHKEQATGYNALCFSARHAPISTMHGPHSPATRYWECMEDVATTASKLVPLKEQPTMECSSHGEPLKVYCNTCDKLVCHLCTTAKSHRNHDYEPINDAFPRHQKNIVDNLEKVKTKLGAITTAVQAVKAQEEDFLQQVRAARREIETTVQQLMQLLQESERQLIRELDQVTDAYIEKISARKKEVTQDGRIVVSEWCNHRLQVLTAEGAFIATVGSKGSQPLHFDYPFGVAVHHNGQVFVSDTDNHRVQVLNADLTFSHCFGSKGTQPGEFNDPRDIAIDADGMVYVSDYCNNRVQKFTPEGKLLAVIDSRKGRLNLPYGLCFDANGILYVTEYDNTTVSMFSSNGKFLGYIGDSDGSIFNGPCFIVSDKTGRLYISDDNRVVTY